MLNTKKLVEMILMLALSIAACGANTTTPTSPTQTINNSAYPIHVAPTLPPLTGDAYPSSSASPVLTPEIPTEALVPELGKGSISGVLYSYGGVPGVLRGTIFYLLPAIGDDNRQIPPIISGPDIARGDRIAQTTDDKGQFFLNDIAPGNYFIVVWAPNNWIPAEVSQTEQMPRLVEVTEGRHNALGVLYLVWP
jgi:hypothetical protein